MQMYEQCAESVTSTCHGTGTVLDYATTQTTLCRGDRILFPDTHVSHGHRSPLW